MGFAIGGPRIRKVSFTPAAGEAGQFTTDPVPTGIDLDADDPRAIRLLRAWVSHRDLQRGASADFDTWGHFLKLSQQNDLTPGLLLEVENAVYSGNAAAVGWTAAYVNREPARALEGTLWVAKYWGYRALEHGGVVAFSQPRLHVLYEVLPIDFETQFMLWEQVDNVAPDDYQDWWQP